MAGGEQHTAPRYLLMQTLMCISQPACYLDKSTGQHTQVCHADNDALLIMAIVVMCQVPCFEVES